MTILKCKQECCFVIFCSFRETNKYPIKLTIIAIIATAILLNMPYCMWNSTNFVYFASTRCFQFLVQALIPCVLIIYMNYSLHQKLKLVLKGTYSANFQKSLFKARLSLAITGIFIIGQLVMWLPLPYEVKNQYFLTFDKRN